MKLTIDTQHDTHEDISKVIKMLQHLVGESSYSNYSNESSSKNIFDDPSPSLSSSEDSYGSSEPSSESGEVQSNAPTNAFSAMFGGDAPTPSTSESGITSYGDEEGNDEKKLNLDEEIIPY
jgi:hypothetical protein